ncbi:hypothetical protein AB9P05_03075 [Roseivirga sp. BDSF3-8]|uniref:hypothetical protein n=1 Tax=Roseivirga sp. BDSF3-8 TaxID=3241598 RepID=UPI0035321875
MKDKLKDFISENRQAFDTERASPDLWNRINAELDERDKRKKKIFFRPWMGVAASILIAVVAYWAGTFHNDGTSENERLAINSDRGGAYGQTADDEFTQAVSYYREEITERKQVLKSAAVSDSIQNVMLSDLQELDHQFQALREQQKKVTSEKVTSAMILNLQMQLRILNQQLDILNQQKEVKNDPDIRQL